MSFFHNSTLVFFMCHYDVVLIGITTQKPKRRPSTWHLTTVSIKNVSCHQLIPIYLADSVGIGFHGFLSRVSKREPRCTQIIKFSVCKLYYHVRRFFYLVYSCLVHSHCQFMICMTGIQARLSSNRKSISELINHLSARNFMHWTFFHQIGTKSFLMCQNFW